MTRAATAAEEVPEGAAQQAWAEATGWAMAAGGEAEVAAEMAAAGMEVSGLPEVEGSSGADNRLAAAPPRLYAAARRPSRAG